MELKAIASRLIDARPAIEQILREAGTVGLSYGVIHQGQVAHIDNFGHRDYENKLSMNEETIMPICSMTKGLFTAALALLVDQGKLDWESPVHKLLPEFSTQSATLKDRATLIDFLSMKSGIESYNVWDMNNRLTIPPNESMNVINSLQSVSDLRYAFSYNNWGYEIAAHAYEKASGETWDAAVHREFFEPLKLTRTDAKGDRDNLDNVAKSYMVLDDLTPVQIRTAEMSSKTIMGAAGGIVSCVKDLLTLYSTVLKAMKHQFETGETSTPDNPFKRLTSIMSAKTQLVHESYHESTYALGWLRTQLPNQLCKISTNYGVLGTGPVTGKDAPTQLIVSHYGSMPGNFAGVLLFPESETAIVALMNTTPPCDMSDWITQFLTQVVFDFPKKVDLLPWVKKTVDLELVQYEKLAAEIHCSMENDTYPTNLEQYAGMYFSATRILCFEVRTSANGLLLLFGGRDDDAWTLTRCRGDTYSWLQPRNELVKRGRSVLRHAGYFQIRFERDSKSNVSRLFWQHDAQWPKGEVYEKEQ